MVTPMRYECIRCRGMTGSPKWRVIDDSWMCGHCEQWNDGKWAAAIAAIRASGDKTGVCFKCRRTTTFGDAEGNYCDRCRLTDSHTPQGEEVEEPAYSKATVPTSIAASVPPVKYSRPQGTRRRFFPWTVLDSVRRPTLYMVRELTKAGAPVAYQEPPLFDLSDLSWDEVHAEGTMERHDTQCGIEYTWEITK